MSELRHQVVAGDEPSVVLLHEGAGSGVLWDRHKDAIRGRRRAVTYDRRGYGKSPRDVMLDSDHFEQAVEDLGDLLRETCDGPVDLVGHSDGGSVALLAAVRHPEAIRSVCAVSTHVYADPYTASALRALGPVQSWDERTRVLYETQHGDDWMDVVAGWIGMWLAGGLSRWDLRPELPEIEVPVLVAHDRADPLSPTLHARSIQESVQSARVSWYHTGSHRPHLAERDRFCEELQAFWADASSDS